MTMSARQAPRAAGRWLTYVAIVLALAPAVALAAVALRSTMPRGGALLAAALPFVACAIGLVGRTRERATLFRALAAALLAVTGVASIDSWFLFIPGALAMGLAAIIAFLA